MEIIYKSIFKSELKNFLAYENSIIQKPHFKEIKDLDIYFRMKKTKEITELDYYDYIYDYFKSSISIKNRYKIILKFCKFLINLNYSSIFFEEIKLDDLPDYNPHIFSSKEIENILNTIDTKVVNDDIDSCYSIIFRLYISCGLRPSEAINLQWKDINLDKQYIDIILGKNEISRRIFLSSSMYKSLKNYFVTKKFQNEEKVFNTNRKKVIKLLKEVLIDNHIFLDVVRVHDFRHTFATNALDKMIYQYNMIEEEALIYLQIYMGHSNERSTQYYLHLTRKMKKEITNATNTYIYPNIQEVDYE